MSEPWVSPQNIITMLSWVAGAAMLSATLKVQITHLRDTIKELQGAVKILTEKLTSIHEKVVRLEVRQEVFERTHLRESLNREQ